MKRWNQKELADFNEGRHFHLHELLGAHRVGGVAGGATRCVWAPAVRQVLGR